MAKRRDAKFRDQGAFDFDAPPAGRDEGKASRDETWREKRPDASADRAAVLRLIVAAGARGVTTYELAEAMGRPQNCISGRITELKAAGAIVHTSARRPTARSTASVIVAKEFVGVAANETKEETALGAGDDVMPDQLTCTGTVRDTRGEPVRPGNAYEIYNGRKPVSRRARVYEDEQGNLCVMHDRQGAHPMRIDETPEGLRWVWIEEVGHGE